MIPSPQTAAGDAHGRLRGRAGGGVGEIGFKLLDAPITRVAAEDLPVPNAKPLEDKIFSAKARLRPKVEKLLAF